MKVSHLTNFLNGNREWIKEEKRFFIDYDVLMDWIDENMDNGLEELEREVEFLKTNLYSLIIRVEELEDAKRIAL